MRVTRRPKKPRPKLPRDTPTRRGDSLTPPGNQAAPGSYRVVFGFGTGGGVRNIRKPLTEE